MDAPRRSAPVHIWQREHAAEVAEAAGAGADIGQRNRTAKILFEAEPEDVRLRIAEMVEEEYLLAKQQYDAQMTVGQGLIPTLDADEQQA